MIRESGDQARRSGDARLGTAAGRWIVTGTVLGSTVTAAASGVVNVALPAIAEDLGASTSEVQWLANAYLLPLAALILVAGSAGDLLGHRRVFLTGAAVFALGTLACVVAPATATLIAARVLQGIGAAAMTPASLALIDATFVPEERSRAIAVWASGSALASAGGPFLGGVLVDAAGWRWVFLVMLPLLAVAGWAALRHVPERDDRPAAGEALRRIDVPGAALSAVAISGLVLALVQGSDAGWGSPLIVGALVVTVVAGVAFVGVERRVHHPLLPSDLFRSRQFTGANVMTLLTYAGIAGGFFFTAVAFQTLVGWSAAEAGAALIPSSVVMIVASPTIGRWAGRTGPRWWVAGGSLAVGVGLAMLARVDEGASWAVDVLPASLVLGGGLAAMVPTLTSAVMAAVDPDDVGIGSAVNNAAARASGLLAIAALPPLVGGVTDGYAEAMLVCAAACVVGAVVAAATIGRGVPTHTAQAPSPLAGCSQVSLPDDVAAVSS